MAERLVVTGDVLWDGTDRAPLQDGAVIIEGDRIVMAGPRRSLPIPDGPDVRTLSFPGATLLPGLIDTHVHLIWPGDGTPADVFTRARSDSELLLLAARNARAALRAGVTTLRDVGSRGRVALDLRDAIAAGIAVGPRVLAAGPPITIRGGHMHYLGGEADTAAEIRRVARRNWRMGVDFLKLVANGGGTPRTHPWIPAYSQEEIAAAVAEAHDRETHITVHANATEAIRRATLAGVDGIEHCTFLRAEGEVGFDEALAEEIVRRGVYLGHTLQAAYRSLERARERWDTLSTQQRAAIDLRRRVWEAQMHNYGRLLEMGARVVAATDAGWSLIPFGEYALGMELLVQAGASPLQALAGGTRVAAEALGLGDQLGTLEPGKIADLVVVAGDPTQNIADLWNVLAVIKDGAVVVEQGRFNG